MDYLQTSSRHSGFLSEAGSLTEWFEMFQNLSDVTVTEKNCTSVTLEEIRVETGTRSQKDEEILAVGSKNNTRSETHGIELKDLNTQQTYKDETQYVNQEDTALKLPSYTEMLAKAILAKNTRKATLQEIYTFLLKEYPWLETRGKSWKNSVRHTLSFNECFLKIERHDNGKKCNWTVHPKYFRRFSKGKYKKPRMFSKLDNTAQQNVPYFQDLRVKSSAYHQHFRYLQACMASGHYPPQLPRVSEELNREGNYRQVDSNIYSKQLASCNGCYFYPSNLLNFTSENQIRCGLPYSLTLGHSTGQSGYSAYSGLTNPSGFDRPPYFV